MSQDTNHAVVFSTVFEGSLRTGQVSGSHISMRNSLYSYIGTIDGDPATHMSGFLKLLRSTVGVWTLTR